MRAIVLRDPARQFAGHIGFHVGPDAEGSVEVGYTVFPVFRGMGVATEATLGLIAWAREQGVQKVIASIAPTNTPSLRVAEKLGFVQTGTQWDEEDGEELVFELRL